MLSENRQRIFESVLGTDSKKIIDYVHNSDGTIISSTSLPMDMSGSGISKDVVDRARLVEAVAVITGDDLSMATAILGDKNVKSLRDVALQYDSERVARMDMEHNTSKLLLQNGDHQAPAARPTSPATPDIVSSSMKSARLFQRRLFQAEPTAVLQRMVTNDEILIHPSRPVREAVVKVLDSQPSFNIRQTSVLNFVASSSVVDEAIGLDQDIQTRDQVIQSLKLLQRTQALSPTPDAVAPLLNSGMTSAFRVSSMPQKQFVKAMAPALATANAASTDKDAESLAHEIHAHAMNSRVRLDSALLQIFQTIKGTGLAIMDGVDNMDTRVSMLRKKAAGADMTGQINLEALFGGMDFCDCDDCSDVTSPLAYFVELLQFLRNNNLDPGIPTEKGYAGTALEKLLLRRPDIQHLELTCENANTVLPYIDLANEVMESFVVHLKDYSKNWTKMKQVKLQVFNVEDETTDELLSAPQHTNYAAYCILKNAKFPMGSLPYFQPLDAIRIYLQYLGTSRYELIDYFRRPEKHPGLVLTADQAATLSDIHTQIQDRAAASEYLSISLDEFIILTKEMFWPKSYFDITEPGTAISVQQYHDAIGVRPTNEYWGYSAMDDMLSTESITAADGTIENRGLCWVKAQFLQRSGLSYPETVDLVRTRFVNPMYPTGMAKVILESITFSYRFLQSLVDPTECSKSAKFKLLIDFLVYAQPWVEIFQASKDKEGKSSHKQKNTGYPSLSKKEICSWVYTWFECLGKIVVLESGEGPELPIEGPVIVEPLHFKNTKSSPKLTTRQLTKGPSATEDSKTDSSVSASAISGQVIGYLQSNGEIRDKLNGTQLIATVAVNGQVFTPSRDLLVTKYPSSTIVVVDKSVDTSDTENLTDIHSRAFISNPELKVAFVNSDGYLEWLYIDSDKRLVKWLPTVDTCNIDKVRLLHLDGTALTSDEWDRIQRFIRLYKKIGWTIDEIDKAVTGLYNVPETKPVTPDPLTPQSETVDDDSRILTFNDFKDNSCSCADPSCCSCSECDGDAGDDGSDSGNDTPCPCDPKNKSDITPSLIIQLMYIKKLQFATSLDLDKLLVFWGDIGTQGIMPLYTKLFLAHNILGIDTVFKPDQNGNVFTTATKISDHVPVILAALSIKSDVFAAILHVAKLDVPGADRLTLDTISAIYRCSLLAKTVGASTPSFFGAIDMFGGAFASAKQTLDFVTLWNSMSNAGFTVKQLLYVISGKDDPLRPLAPAKVKVLRTVKTLLDGLDSIQEANADLTDLQKASVSADDVANKAALLYSQSVVSQIVGLVEGTNLYTTNAPSNLTISIPTNLSTKVTYAATSSGTATLTVKGNLTDEEKSDAKALSADTGWTAAIDRAGRQSVNLVKSLLSDVFGEQEDAAIAALTAGDVPATPAVTETDVGDPGTAPAKRVYFLDGFLPYLRSQLSEILIITTMSAVAGISSPDITRALLEDILTVGTASPPESTLNALKDIQTNPAGTSSTWTGYLVPPSSDTYTFVGISDSTPSPLVLDGVLIPFKYQQEDPSNIWSTDPVPLTGGQLYPLQVTGLTVPGNLQWMTARDTVAPISSSALVPDYSVSSTMDVFVKFAKAAIIINGFSLSAKEVVYLQNNGASFSNFDLNALSMDAWKRILAYQGLRDSLPKLELTLIDLFAWAQRPDSKVADIAGKISAVTSWDVGQLKTLISSDNFDLGNLKAFTNEIALLKLKKAIDIITKLAVTDANIPFNWINLRAHFTPTRKIAEDIRKNIRSRYSLDDFENVVKPLHDQLRMNQRDALIAYLVVQPDLKKWGVIDADSLFEFFLIDVQMGACMQTSRIKQAISTVQSFVQRCILGLEENYGIANDALDSTRWNWMSKQTVWTANRKVFLYPENWIVSNLRDDKSPFYLALEGDLLKNDISPQNNQDAFKTYLHKLDQVASLRAIGLYVDSISNNSSMLHCFARTESSPYFFFYRTLQSNGQKWTGGQWTPWMQVQVDIPMYKREYQKTIFGPTPGQIVGFTIEALQGCYVTPVVWNGRLFIFIGHFYQKTVPNPDAAKVRFEDYQGSAKTAGDVAPYQCWEIKMGWSELRLGKWTQKQLSTDSLVTTAVPADSLELIDSYKFVPQITTGAQPSILIGVWHSLPIALVGQFEFRGTGLFKVATDSNKLDPSKTGFHYLNPIQGYPIMSSLQRAADGSTKFYGQVPYIKYVTDSNPDAQMYYSSTTSEKFYHPYAHQLLAAASSSDDFKSILDVFTPINDTAGLNSLYGGYGSEVGADGTLYPKFHELKSPYGIYDWEIGFHAPMEMADALLNSQQFDKALDMLHCVFHPYADGPDITRVWQWKPFKLVSTEYVLETLFNSLKPNTPDDALGPINEWRNNPFAPHVVARDRPSAYMKWTAMKYIQTLIAYGDYYFRRNTLEDLPSALQCYILASHIYGPKGQRIPKRGKKKAETYWSLLDRWDAFSNAVVDMELIFPFSNQSPQPIGVSNNEVVLADIFGFATTTYFCIPDNPDLRALRDTIDDRLFKIRHCMDINGNIVSRPLFDAPINPLELVEAVASGLSISSALNDLNAPMPNYRFYYLLQKALEICGELKGLCAQFLSVKEKRDTEALTLLRNTHDIAINNLQMEMKKKQLDEAQKTLETMGISRESPSFRYQYYSSLAGAGSQTLADDLTEYQAFQLDIEDPTSDGDLKLTKNEKLEMDGAASAQDWNEKGGYVETLSGILNALPSFNIHGTPFGVGVEIAWGMPNLAAAASATARYIQVLSGSDTFDSTNAGRKATNIKQYQERIHQMNLAGFEYAHITSQMRDQQLRVDIANQDIVNQQKTIDNLNEVDQFLRNKYTNDDLYNYLETSLTAVVYQTYTLAYDLAKKAEAAYYFERSTATDQNFIQFGYFNQGRDGLQSGEQLYSALKKMEAAYQLDRGYDFEVTKSISVRQLNPLALLQLREQGICQIDLPEVLFDMDFPGHYNRRIKSVTLTIPCVVGPYTSVNCTLTLVQHRYRTDPTANDAKDYLEKMDGIQDKRFASVRVPIGAVAISSGQNDGGVFELQLKDERYIPFEGAGCISTWKMQLPTGFRQFDYDSITDVVLGIRYTSCNGGDKLRAYAAGSVSSYIKSIDGLSQTQGLFTIFDLKAEFSTEWAKLVLAASQIAAGKTVPEPQVLVLRNLVDRLPMFTKGRDASKIIAIDVSVLTPMALAKSDFALNPKYVPPPPGSTPDDSDDVSFDSGPVPIGKLKAFTASDVGEPVGTWALKVKLESGVPLDRIFLLVRYVLPDMS